MELRNQGLIFDFTEVLSSDEGRIVIGQTLVEVDLMTAITVV